MHNQNYYTAKSTRHYTTVVVGMLFLLILSGCGMGNRRTPPTPTPTPLPTATPTPQPTPTLAPGESAPPTAATPQVVIPDDFERVADERLQYSFAVPDDWSELDIRSSQIERMAGLLGMGEQVASLQEFLDSADGQAVGKIYITGIASAMFGGLPSFLNVTVLPAPTNSPEALATRVQEAINANIGSLGGATTVAPVVPTTINNLPALTTEATIDLSAMGMDNQAYLQVTALIANEQIYLLSIAVPAADQADRAAEIAQIVGTFRPE